MIAFTGSAGIYLQKAGRNYTNGRSGTLANIVDNAKRYGQEFVRFSVFPMGYIGDMERGEDWLPDLGVAYSSSALFSALRLADVFARKRGSANRLLSLDHLLVPAVPAFLVLGAQQRGQQTLGSPPDGRNS